MDVSMEAVALTLIMCIVGFLVWDTYFTGKTETVVSTVDGNSYVVKSLPDKQEAADLLATLRQKLETLVNHLQKMFPDDDRTVRLVAGFHPDRISEGGDDSSQYTSYSVNKGERIVFCLRSRSKNPAEQNKLVDVNMMIFVAVHELAHIATESVGHTDEFWKNMRYLLEQAIDIGIYTKQDFKAKPQKYCGVDVTSSPLDN